MAPSSALPLRTFDESSPSDPLPFAQGTDEAGRFADALDQDVACAVEGGLRIRDAFFGVDVFCGLRFGIERRIGEQRIAKRLEPGLARDLRLGASLGLEGRVKVLELDLGGRAVDLARKLGRELALLLDRFQNGRAAVLELGQIAEPLLELAKLRVVETAGALLAVAGDERAPSRLRRAAPRRLRPGRCRRRARTRCVD